MNIQVKVLRSLEEVEQARQVWSILQWYPEADIDFYKFLFTVRPEILRPHAIVLSRAGVPITLLAGRIELGYLEIKFGYRVLWRAKVCRMVIPYGGLMGEADGDAGEVLIRQVGRSLIEEKANLIIWGGIRRGSRIHQLLSHIPNPFCRDYVSRPVQHWGLNLPASLEEFLEKRLSKKPRYWARRIMRLLESDFPGQVKYVRFSAPDEVPRLFEDALVVARKTYQWGLGVGLRDNAEHRKRLEFEATKGWHRGFVLYVKQQPVAFWICTVYGDIVSLDSTGYDPAFREYEVGTVLFLRMLEEMCRERLKHLDFGLGTAAYKEKFGDACFEEITMCTFASTLRGGCLNGLRLMTQGPIELSRRLARRMGVETRVKRIWRRRATLSVGLRKSQEGTSTRAGVNQASLAGLKAQK